MSVSSMSLFFALLTLVALAIALGGFGLLVTGALDRGGTDLLARARVFTDDYGLLLAWAIAATATLGSLYYSEIAHYTPCKLCWYQRIAMYPLSVILGIAASKRDVGVRRYVLPIVGIGAAISIYHYVLQRFPSLEGTSCDPTAPCTFTWVWQFHFISIPFMALSGFAAIGALMLLLPKNDSGRSTG